VPPNLD